MVGALVKEVDRTMESRSDSLFRKPLVPTPEETEQSKRILGCVHGKRGGELALRIKDDFGATRTVALPTRLGRFVLDTLSEIASGNAVRVLQVRRELTTHEAAELLNVSRTHLIGLLEKGAIPYRLVGSHRRIALMDLLLYKAKTDAQRKEAVDAIAAEAQELKLYE
jgi:excisionase family DNA binding protein